MYHLKLTLRSITPILMYGANKSKPELRATEFKGLMRFWWRAIKASDDIEALKKEEINIFGGITDTKGIKSKVKIFLDSKPGSDSIKNNLQEILRNNNNLAQDKIKSIEYLLYSAVINKYKPKLFGPNTQFDLIINSRCENAFKHAIAALWVLIFFGGVGSRSRRGGGNLYVEKVQGETYGLHFIPQANSSEELATWLKENFTIIKKIISPSHKSCTSYSNLNFSRFIVSSNNFDSFQEAMADIGARYKDFRFEHKNSISSGNLGLPVVHGIRIKKISKVIGKKGDIEFCRRASPLILKILNSQGKYYWMALRLTGEFLPKGAQLVWGNNYSKPSEENLDKFWNSLKKTNDNDADNLEYKLEYTLDPNLESKKVIKEKAQN
ncbi:type III-B CRISPR module RAMP protein Cmr1 [Anaerobranca gottschalkii]|uniref:CRISPR-associated protein Cmr1 n=1 Tax=Anaerobranca gottschalkii DSM 13577 TaxID=1120990 RepID=A0A1I0C0G1_9FIRM|nr:type III-B CRISPR module RAMP protein Cmr1 [Anaerobranca gottschalkii]SET12871.1 CRISPR-associated protein Cmr1 [Anaerobranca gottschalkii DSM 13577]